MKKKSTSIKSLCIAAALIMCSAATYAATITATVSGNWSNATTWSGGAAGGTVSDNIIIPAGITVTMDMDVQVQGLASIAVTGSLTGASSKSLTINSLGSLSGSGYLQLSYLELATLGGMSFSGSATINKMVTSATSLSLTSQLTLVDTLHLKAGSLSLGTGANLMLNTNSNIKVEDGSLATTGGLFTATNSYNVLYVGSSKSTGMELSGSGASKMDVQLSSATQSLTLGSNSTVNGAVHHNMGTLVLNGKTLTIKGDYMSMNNSKIAGSTSSNLSIQTASALSSDLLFTSGSQSLNDLEINIASGGNANLGTNLAVSGEIKLMKGKLNVINSSTLTLNAGSEITMNDGSIMLTSGSFNGNASYNVNYIGSSKMGDLELSGTGLNNVDLQLTNANDSVKIANNTTVKGALILNKGSFNLNGKKLYLQGTLSTTTNGYFQGNGASELYINTTAGLMDTMYFDNAMNHLNSLTVNTGNSSNVMLGSELKVESLLLTTGGVTIFDKDLTINATGSITGASSTKYIQIKGTGSLVMNVNSPAAYVMYPIGTTTSMAAAYIQRNSGNGMLGVNTHNGIYQQGTSGIDNATTESVVNRTWDIKSINSGSVDLNIKFDWTTSMEVNSFDRSNAYISHYTNSAWDVQSPSSASVVSAGNYQISRSGITSLSPFAVVDNDSEVGIKENEFASASVYPNPTTEMLNIKGTMGNTFKIEVIDGIGNVVLSKVVVDESSKNIDLTNLNTGVYFVKISNGNSQSVKRIVKL